MRRLRQVQRTPISCMTAVENAFWIAREPDTRSLRNRSASETGSSLSSGSGTSFGLYPIHAAADGNPRLAIPGCRWPNGTAACGQMEKMGCISVASWGLAQIRGWRRGNWVCFVERPRAAEACMLGGIGGDLPGQFSHHLGDGGLVHNGCLVTPGGLLEDARRLVEGYVESRRLRQLGILVQLVSRSASSRPVHLRRGRWCAAGRSEPQPARASPRRESTRPLLSRLRVPHLPPAEHLLASGSRRPRSRP